MDGLPTFYAFPAYILELKVFSFCAGIDITSLFTIGGRDRQTGSPEKLLSIIQIIPFIVFILLQKRDRILKFHTVDVEIHLIAIRNSHFSVILKDCLVTTYLPTNIFSITNVY